MGGRSRFRLPCLEAIQLALDGRQPAVCICDIRPRRLACDRVPPSFCTDRPHQRIQRRMIIDLVTNSLLNLLRRAKLRRDDIDLLGGVVGAEESFVGSGGPALHDGLSVHAIREIVNGILDLDRHAEGHVPGTSPDIEYGFSCLRFSKRASFYPSGRAVE
jgi:hypothetical protein